MAINVDPAKFLEVHEAFKQHMLRSSKRGAAFTDFHHDFLVDDEISYKWKVYHEASHLLMLPRWNSWRNHPGRIVQTVRDACRASANLLEHKYGLQRSSDGALYKVNGLVQTGALENELVAFFLGGPIAPSAFGPRFDRLANYLRANRLGCRWDFMSYLAFLACPQLYFPIRSTHFDALLDRYGTGVRISGDVSWENYRLLLELAEVVKSRLALYGQPDAIELQSYMWVASYLIRDLKVTPLDIDDTEPDFAEAFAARAARAKERERIGLLGERYVYEIERAALINAGRTDLAHRVRMASFDNETTGYDIVSFTPVGAEKHIEVKATVRSRRDDNGFWLSASEKLQAETDETWEVFRVWSIDTAPQHENIGNVVQCTDQRWELTASSWYVQRHQRWATGEGF